MEKAGEKEVVDEDGKITDESGEMLFLFLLLNPQEIY
jgi:hypothetical protein